MVVDTFSTTCTGTCSRSPASTCLPFAQSAEVLMALSGEFNISYKLIFVSFYHFSFLGGPSDTCFHWVRVDFWVLFGFLSVSCLRFSWCFLSHPISPSSFFFFPISCSLRKKWYDESGVWFLQSYEDNYFFLIW